MAEPPPIHQRRSNPRSSRQQAFFRDRRPSEIGLTTTITTIASNITHTTTSRPPIWQRAWLAQYLVGKPGLVAAQPYSVLFSGVVSYLGAGGIVTHQQRTRLTEILTKATQKLAEDREMQQKIASVKEAAAWTA